MMKIGYYPGCSLEGTARAYDLSARQVCERLGVELTDIPGWTCCGSSPALKLDGLLSTALAAHNLVQTRTHELDSIVAPCPFCFRRLKSALDETGKDRGLKTRVESAIAAQVDERVTIYNLLGFLRHTVGLEAIAKSVVKPLTGLRVLPYYGCYLVKPAQITNFDDPENPVTMDDILATLGAEMLDWDFKTECCGAGLSVCQTETVERLCRRLADEARFRRADIVAVACQLCQANLDMRQGPADRWGRPGAGVPVLYFTQLMGLAFGFSARDMRLGYHLVDAGSVLETKGLPT